MIRPLTLLLAPILVASTTAGPQAIRYAPAPDTTLVRVVQLVTELDKEEMTSTMNGQEIPPEFLPEMELTVLHASTFVVTDRIAAVADGRPVELHRTFDSVELQSREELEMYGEVTTSEGKATSPYEGQELHITWSEDEEAYAMVLVEDDEVVEGLREDMDLRGFLPTGEVEEGDSWELEAEVLLGLFYPGGDLALEWEGDDLQGQPFTEDQLTGKVEARFAGIQDDGQALIEITGEVRTATSAEGNLEHIPVAEGTATITTEDTFELDGRLYWNLETGHMDSLELDAATRTEHVTMKDPGQPGGDFSATVILVGTWECRIEVSDG